MMLALLLTLSAVAAEPKPCTVRWFYDPWERYRGPRITIKDGVARTFWGRKLAEVRAHEATSLVGDPIEGSWAGEQVHVKITGERDYISRPYPKRDWWVIFDEHGDDGSVRIEFNRNLCSKADILVGVVGLWTRLPKER